MANYNKQFNFRNGVQVDNDNFIVSPTGLVGIGTTIPTQVLDVRGDAQIVGLATVNRIFTPDLTATSASITNLTLGTSVIGGGVSITSGIVTASGSGIVTYYGDGGRLLNLPTSQWLDIDVGLGFTSIYAQGYVGVSTNDPRFPFQVSGNSNTSLAGFSGGLGIGVEGDVLTTGIVTASKFVGVGSDLTGLNASSIAYGTISNDRIPVLVNSKMPADISVTGAITASGGFVGGVTGNVTGNLTGNVTGTASTALSLSGTPNIVVGLVTASDINVQNITSGSINSSGIVTSSSVDTSNISASSVDVTGDVGSANLNVTGIVTSSEFNVGTGGTIVNITSNGRIAIGSDAPTRPFEIISNGIAEIELVGSESRIIFAEQKSGLGIADSAGVIRYGNSNDAFELVNYAPGDFNFYLHGGGPGINTGRFNWVYGQDFLEKMSLTYEGKLGLGVTNPSDTLHVVGTSTVTGNSLVGGNLTVSGDLNVTGNMNGTITLPSIFEGNVYSNTGFSTFSNVIVSSGSSLGIGTEIPISGLDARDQTGLFAKIGVGTENVSDTASLQVAGNVLVSDGGIGIGTTSYNPSAGNIQIHAPLTELNDGHINLNSNTTVGFNTSDPAAIFDFGNVGAATTRPVMVVPNIDNSTITGIAATPTGSVIFNTDTSKFQGYTGTSWVDFH